MPVNAQALVAALHEFAAKQDLADRLEAAKKLRKQALDAGPTGVKTAVLRSPGDPTVRSQLAILMPMTSDRGRRHTGSSSDHH